MYISAKSTQYNNKMLSAKNNEITFSSFSLAHLPGLVSTPLRQYVFAPRAELFPFDFVFPWPWPTRIHRYIQMPYMYRFFFLNIYRMRWIMNGIKFHDYITIDVLDHVPQLLLVPFLDLHARANSYTRIPVSHNVTKHTILYIYANTSVRTFV